MAIRRKKSHYERLQKKWVARHKKLQRELWTKHGETLSWLSNNYRQLAAGSLGGLFLLSSPPAALLPPSSSTKSSQEISSPVDKSAFLISDLSNILPKDVRMLTEDEEQKISEILSHDFRFRVVAELSGKRLNRSYGYIGKEQHLARFPGDTMYTHFDSQQDAVIYGKEGMAPGLGAWRYFAPSAQEMTEKDKLRERYYIAVQTFLAPHFYDNVKEYVEFFKYRKMLVVNPQNGRAIVTVIGDAGPAEWTGKHLGGSPEVMHHLEREDGARRGAVLYFFIDDPEEKVPLGPIETK